VSARPFLLVFGTHTSAETPLAFAEGIAYGHPRVEAVLVGSRLLALYEFPPTSAGRYDRLSTQRVIHTNYRRTLSFEVVNELDAALRTFGSLVRQAAPGVFAGRQPATSSAA
jgi:hypothetical protein